MNEQEFGSDTDDSDFCPENFKDDADSESMDEKADALDDNDEDNSKPKKKQKRKKSRKAAKPEILNEVEQKSEKALDPDEEKRREEALWAEFLGDTETTPSTSSSTVTSTSPKKQNIPKQQKSAAISRPPAAPRQSPPKIFEFAGEEVIVNETKPSASENSSNAIPKASPAVKRPATGGGLSSVLNQISKKNKLSILQKTKLDWDGFKTNQGIAEELQTHNRGRDG